MIVPDRYAKCHRQLINLWQSKEERRAKYEYLRNMGLSRDMAHRLRDWRDEFIDKYFAYAAAADELFVKYESEGKEGK